MCKVTITFTAISVVRVVMMMSGFDAIILMIR